jgi:prevent-host-death family protein
MNEVEAGGKPILVTNRGKKIIALLSVSEYNNLLETARHRPGIRVRSPSGLKPSRKNLSRQ